MTKQPDDRLARDSDGDPELDSYLTALQHFAPSSAFADRIMARVRVEQPRPAAVTIRTGAPVRRRIPTLATAASVGSALWTGVLVAALAGVGDLGAATLNLLAGLAVPLWAGFLSLAGRTAAGLAMQLISGVLALGPALLVFAMAAAVLPPICAVGLYRVLSRTRTQRMSYASR